MPEVGREFACPGQSHSCGPYRAEDLLAGRPPGGLALYRRFEELALGVGEVVLAPAKTRIGFQHCRIFAAVNAIRAGRIDVHILTTKPIGSARIRRVERLGPMDCVNHFTIKSPAQLDAEVVAWLEEGYRWGGV